MIAGHLVLVNRFSRTVPAGSDAASPSTMRAVGLRIAFLAAECEPWAKTGGLADVVDALARAVGALRERRRSTRRSTSSCRATAACRSRGRTPILGETAVAVPDPRRADRVDAT